MKESGVLVHWQERLGGALLRVSLSSDMLSQGLRVTARMPSSFVLA